MNFDPQSRYNVTLSIHAIIITLQPLMVAVLQVVSMTRGSGGWLGRRSREVGCPQESPEEQRTEVGCQSD